MSFLRFYNTIALVSIEGGGVCDWLWPRHFTATLARPEPVYADTVQDHIYEAPANTAKLALIAALLLAWRLRTSLGIEGAKDWVCYSF